VPQVTSESGGVLANGHSRYFCELCGKWIGIGFGCDGDRVSAVITVRELIGVIATKCNCSDVHRICKLEYNVWIRF